MQASARSLLALIALAWLSACSSAEEAPKAKSPNTGDQLSAGGESGKDSHSGSTAEKDSATTDTQGFVRRRRTGQGRRLREG